MTGLEPATSGVTGRRSNQLSYTREEPGRRPDETATYAWPAMRVKDGSRRPAMVGDDGLEPPTLSV